jgi:hypothetical protein
LGTVWADPIDDLIGHSINYRIAVGPRAGQNPDSTNRAVAPELGANQPGFSGRFRARKRIVR